MSIEQHVKAKQIELAASIKDRKKVYLDLRYWIWLRDADAGNPETQAIAELLKVVRTAVANGRIICPISDVVLMELMKQVYSDDRRIATARLIDELSMGVSLINSQTRVGTEVYSLFLSGQINTGRVHTMQELVWTKVCHVLGESFPTFPGMPPDILLNFQQKFIDRLWNSTLTEMVTTMGDQDRDREDFRALSDDTNRQRDLHQAEITSYRRAYDIELRGAIDASSDAVADAVAGIVEGKGGVRSEPGTAKLDETQQSWKDILFHAIKKPKGKSIARTLHIETSLHAALRVDKARRFKPNDFWDFHHASAAIGYCDAFFTEGPLRELCGQKSLGFDKISDCVVVSEPEMALKVATSIIGV